MAPLLSQLIPAAAYTPTGTAAILSAAAAGASSTQSNDLGLPPRPLIPSATEPRILSPIRGKPVSPASSIELFSGTYYAACAFGGVLSCGLTHLAVTPLDVVKCNMQTDPVKYPSIPRGFAAVWGEAGMAGITRGWLPTLVGYSAQGACKFGFYEYFKKTYSDMFDKETAERYQTFIFLAGSASAELIADVALCPMEAVKVKVQTSPGFANGLADGFPKFVALEGYGGLFKGLVPLWARQIPYTMMKFACFENTVQMLYAYVVPKPKAECSKAEQLGVSFLAGYIAGVFCAVVSHPADNLVSKLNQTKGITMGEIVKEMGWWQLFTRGITLRIVMIGTLTGLQWGIYDSFKVAVGLPTTGGLQKK